MSKKSKDEFTKKEVVGYFKENMSFYYPDVSQGWNNYIKHLLDNEKITEKQYNMWLGLFSRND